MKSKIILPALLILGSLFFQSCRKGSMWGIYGKGPVETQSRDLKGFSSLYLDCDADITYVQDSTYQVSVSGQQNILAVLETKVAEGQLRISYLREVRKQDGLKITIHSPMLYSCTIAGSGNISSAAGYTGTTVGFYISGSGNITIGSLICNVFDTKISGSGNITISGGNSNSGSYHITGSGNVVAMEHKKNSAVAKISGSGNITVNVTDTFDATISGSGTIKYKGNPVVTTHLSGSGEIVHLK